MIHIAILVLFHVVLSDSILNSQRFCFPYPNATVIGYQATSITSFTFLNVTNGDYMALPLSSTAFRNTYTMGNGVAYINTSSASHAQNYVSVLSRRISALPCDYYVNVSTSVNITLARGVSCFTHILGGTTQQVKDVVITFDSTIDPLRSGETNYIIKFRDGFTVNLHRIDVQFIGNTSYRNIYWYAHDFLQLFTTSSPPYILYGNFLVSRSFTQATATTSPIFYYG